VYSFRTVVKLLRAAGTALLAFIVGLPLVDTANAQKNQAGVSGSPRVFVLSPAGGRAGTTVEVTITGQDLNEPQGILCSARGVTAEFAGGAEPLKGDPGKGKKKGMATGPVTAVRFKVVIPADTPPGTHDLRFVGRHGVSNPRAFVVGDLPESLEKEPNNDVAEAQRIELNSTVHGIVAAPTDVDYYTFAGKKGQRVIIACLASGIDSRLQAAVELYRAGGALLAVGREYQETDAVLDAVLPADEDYCVRVFAFTYTQGGPEHFYRLTVSTAPWIDAVFPPVVEPGKETQVTVLGRNLPGGMLDPSAMLDGRPLEKLVITVKAPSGAQAAQRLAFTGHVAPRSAGLDGFEFRLRNDTGVSNPYLLTFAHAPVVLDNGANDTPETAQPVTLPCTIAGRIEKKHDRDWYKFTAQKGETYAIDVLGDRIGSPLDLFFTLGREGAKSTTEVDDNPEVLHPQQFFTRTEDPAHYRFTAQEEGTYLLQVTSREADIQAGPRHLYAVRIAPERPDFRLIIMPPSTNQPEGTVLPRRGAEVYTVLVWAQDGFNGEVRLSAAGLPPGVTCPPQIIPAGVRQGSLVVTATPDAEPWAGFFTVTGTATVGEKELVREARPATIVWPVQQNTTALARLDRGLALAVREPGPFRLLPTKETFTAAPGAKLSVALKVERAGDFKAPLQVTLLNFPSNFINFNNNQPLNISAAEATGTLDVRSNVPPGTYTLVFRGSTAVQGRNQRNPTGIALPSIPLTLVVARPTLGEVTVSISPEQLALQPGATGELTVKVKRRGGGSAPLQVQLVPPPGIDFFRAEGVTIQADQDQVKFPVRASSRTKPGTYADVGVRVSAAGRGEGPAPSKDAKFTVKVK
jgi:hypothetical protein